MCPGPLPGVIPGNTGVVSPQSLYRASKSRLGITAVSSSDLPVEGFGKPPSPSTTNIIIFDEVDLHSSVLLKNSIMFSNLLIQEEFFLRGIPRMHIHQLKYETFYQ